MKKTPPKRAVRTKRGQMPAVVADACLTHPSHSISPHPITYTHTHTHSKPASKPASKHVAGNGVVLDSGRLAFQGSGLGLLGKRPFV